MPEIKRTAKAEEDLIDIWVYIAQDKVSAVDSLLDRIEEKFFVLAKQPRLGPRRPDIAPELRCFPVGNYLILYREISVGVEIVRVVHGARRLTGLFSS